MRLLRTALANRRIALLEATWAVASLGTWAFTLVLALYAYEQGGAGAVALAVVVRMAPSALLAPYAALLADRRSRRSVLFAATLARGATAAAAGIAVQTGASFGVVLVLAALFTIAGTAHKPAQAALLPQLATTPTELAAANVASTTIDYAGFLGGSLGAGLLVAGVGAGSSFGACGLPFVAGAIALLMLPADARPDPLGDAEGGPQLFEGFRTVAAEPSMRLLMTIFAASMVVQSVVDVVLVVTAIELLEMGEEGVGWLSGAWGLGGLLGGGAAVVLLRRGRLATGVALGCVVSGLPLSLIAGFPVPAAALALLVVLGVGFAILEVALLTLTQRLAADDVLARVFGVEEVLFVVGSAAGALGAAVLVDAVGIELTLVATGLVLPVLALLLRVPLARFEFGARVPERPYALLRGLPLFAPLPVATVENLALRAGTSSFPAGATVTEQGGDADAFFVIDEGEVDVLVDGALRRRQGPGDFFGEIALLHQCPRTATVRARTPVTLVTMTRDDFLNGIGANARSVHEARAAAEVRLAGSPAPTT